MIKRTQKSFATGAAILGGMGLVSKIIGAVYTIASTNIIGTHGMSYYTTAFPIYTFLLAISSAGLPVAISKMVSERTALNDYKAAYEVFSKAIKAMFAIGLVTTILMIALSKPIATILGRSDASLAIIAIAPSLFFVAILSAFRGYFQGMQQMMPTAISQIIEQTGKAGVGLLLAWLWIGKGEIYGVAGAVLGITVSEFFAFIYLSVHYRVRIADFKKQITSDHYADLTRNIGRKLIYLATPIIVGACAMPLVQLADTAIITNTLNSMRSIVLFGQEVILNSKIVNSLFSLLTAYVNPIINMPAVFSLALAVSLVPSISTSKARGDLRGISNKARIGFKLSILIGLPCAAGLFLLSTPIMHLLFAGLKGENLTIAGNLMGIMAIAVLFLTILQTMTGILQGLGKTYLPVINLFIGICVKILISILFIRMPEVNIRGAAYGTVACYAIAALLDVICVIKYAKARPRILQDFIKPILATACMGLVVYVIMPHVPSGEYSRFVTIGVILIAVAVYGFFTFFFGAINQDDMEYLPGGKRITSMMIRLRIWKAADNVER
ncbi:MAG TPA: polysaccharide biosynthesis protein [Negativicutes bacterium]|nr:polysaccharide biosynthesis protein [Negativicutes bacterium]